MNEVACILSAIVQGEPHAAEKLLPLVYDELRRLTTAWMAIDLLQQVGARPSEPYDGSVISPRHPEPKIVVPVRRKRAEQVVVRTRAPGLHCG
jgi:ECF sigma factor